MKTETYEIQKDVPAPGLTEAAEKEYAKLTATIDLMEVGDSFQCEYHSVGVAVNISRHKGITLESQRIPSSEGSAIMCRVWRVG